MHKLENPARLAELSPTKTLEKIGLHDGMTFADIGAGTGIFTTAAADITHAQVWAADPSAGMREILASKKSALALNNVEILPDVSALPEQSVDLALLCTGHAGKIRRQRANIAVGRRAHAFVHDGRHRAGRHAVQGRRSRAQEGVQLILRPRQGRRIGTG